MQPFVHLHLHTEYSILDGMTRIEPLLDKCKEYNMPAVAVTDHGNMYCAWKFMKAAKARGIKPIVGCEFYVCEDLHTKGAANREYFHLILLAKNNAGYHNLARLNSIAFCEGFYYKPRIDMQTLKQHAEGLVCLSACIQGQLPRLLLADREEDARQLALEFKALFGEDYYIEIQDHGIYEERAVLPQLVALAKELDIPLVATNDVHYLNEEDAEAHDILLCVQTKRFFDEPDRMKFFGTSFYLKTYDEMEELFGQYEGALENTLKIAEKCNVDIGKEQLLPNYVPPDGLTPTEYLRKLVEEGLQRRYPDCTPEIRERVEYEFNVITTMKFVDYYLIVWDFIHYAKSHDIPVGPGRGSGAGSVIAYLIGITEVEPFRYNLMFERFLNPQRKTMPDFDVDFCMNRREEVIDYVHEKYGEGKVTQIVTFGTMAAKNAIRDVARALRVPVSEANRLAKMVPDNFKYTLRHLLGLEKYKKQEDTMVSQELLDEYRDNPTSRRVIDIAMRLEGSPRQTGMHAAGVVICREVISDHVPLQTNGGSIESGGIVTTQYNMVEVEEAGLLKMDFLGLRTLTDIKMAVDYVKEDFGKEIVFDKNSYEDPEVYKMIGSGDTMCIFQLEGGGMTDLMRRMQPDGLEDVIAGISLYRPGPMQYIGTYIEGKFNRDSVKYLHPKMQPILDVTYGCIVYQEQVMDIVRALGGFSMALADNVRYAMSKKKLDLMRKLGELFVYGGTWQETGETVPGCIQNGIEENVAREIYNELNDFSQYAFNKSHAACYAHLTYQTAYLKRYYPTELLCAMLNNRISDISLIKKYINYAKSINIDILPPDINKSTAGFRVENGALRFGLGGIKNIGVSVVEEIVKEREKGEFTDMNDLFERASAYLNKRLIENMIKGGAFDCFGRSRRDMLQNAPEEFAKAQAASKKRFDGQMSIFDLLPDLKTSQPAAPRETMKEYSKEILYGFEKEVLGFYVTGSPLDDYDVYKKRYAFDFNTSETAKTEEEEGFETQQSAEVQKRFVTTGGILHDLRTVAGKDGKMMAFGTLEDNFDSIEVAMYASAFEKYKSLLVEDAFVVVKGNLGDGRDGYKITIRELINPKEAEEDATEAAPAADVVKPTLWLKMDKNNDTLDKVNAILENYAGDLDVVAKMDGKRYALSQKVRECTGVIYELEQLLGEKNALFYTKKQG